MIQNLKLYFYCSRLIIRGSMLHRFSFFAGIIGQWLGYGATYFSLYVMVSQFGTLENWTAAEVLFMYAFNMLSYSLAASVFFKPCTRLPMRIRNGEFDISLTRPVNTLFYELCIGYNFVYIGHFILSFVIIATFSQNINLEFSLKNIILFIIMLISAVLLQSAFLLLSSVASFFFLNNNPVMDFMLKETKRFINYPICIYWDIIQIILTIFVPVAFISYYPVKAILGKEDNSMFSSSISYFSPIISLVIFLISIYIWNLGLSKYKSTGS